MPDFTLEQVESSPEYLQEPHDIQKAISREYISLYGPEPVFSLVEKLHADDEFNSMDPEEQQSLVKDVFDFYGVDAPKEFSMSGLVGGIKDIGKLIYDLPVQTKAAIGSAIEDKDPRERQTIADQWRAEGEARTAQRESELSQEQRSQAVLPFKLPFMDDKITRGDIADTSSSTGFSAVAGGAALAGGLAGSIVPVPGAAAVGGMAASGKAAYNMDRTMFTEQLFKSVEEHTGKPLSDEERKALIQLHDNDIFRHAMWEAGPEAAGNVFGVIPGLKNIAEFVGKKGLAKLGVGIAKLYGVETGTETVTQMGQQRAEARTGITQEPERQWTSGKDWNKSFQEVAPQTFLLSSIMGGGSVATAKVKKALTPKQIEDELANIPLDADPEELAAHIDQNLSAADEELLRPDTKPGLNITLLTEDDLAGLEAVRAKLADKTDEEVIAVMNAATPNPAIKPYLDKIFKERLGPAYPGPQRGNLPDTSQPPVADAPQPTAGTEAKPSPTSPQFFGDESNFGEFPGVQDVGLNTPENTLRQERARQIVEHARNQNTGGVNDFLQQIADKDNTKAEVSYPVRNEAEAQERPQKADEAEIPKGGDLESPVATQVNGGDSFSKKFAEVSSEDIEEEDNQVEINPQIIKEATQEANTIINADPRYQLMAKIKREGGLNLKQSVEMFSQDTVNTLNRKYPGLIQHDQSARFGARSKSPDEAATENGYDSAEAMILDIAQAPTKKAIVAKLTKEKEAEWAKWDEIEKSAIESETVETEKKNNHEVIDNPSSLAHGEEMNTNPTEPQRKAENYKTVKKTVDGLKISIENETDSGGWEKKKGTSVGFKTLPQRQGSDDYGTVKEQVTILRDGPTSFRLKRKVEYEGGESSEEILYETPDGDFWWVDVNKGVNPTWKPLIFPSEESAKNYSEEDSAIQGEPSTEKHEVIDNPSSLAHGEEMNTNPTEPQRKAENYKTVKKTVDGLKISIENAIGKTRSGIDSDGKEWSVEMKSDYGRILGSVGYDKDHVDVFITPGYQGGSGDVYVVNQYNQDGTFDEHKVVLGAKSEKEALETYNSNYESGWDAGKSVTKMSLPAFRKWVFSKAPKKGAVIRGGKTKDAERQSETNQEGLSQPAETSTGGNGGTVVPGRSEADADNQSSGVGQSVTDKDNELPANLSKQFKSGQAWARKKLADQKYGKDADQLLEHAKSHPKADTDFWKGVIDVAQQNNTPSASTQSAPQGVTSNNVQQSDEKTGQENAADKAKASDDVVGGVSDKPKASNPGHGIPLSDAQLETIEEMEDRLQSIHRQIETLDNIQNPRNFDKHHQKYKKLVERRDNLLTRQNKLKREQKQQASEKVTPNEAKTDGNGVENKVFTEDMYQAALDRMKDRNKNLNSGFDPMAMQDLFVIGGYHFEKGVRGFAQWSKEVIGSVGESWEKYLPDVYSMLRKTDGIDKEGMSTPAEVEGIVGGEKPSVSKKQSFADLYNNDKIKEAAEDLIASPDIEVINEKLDSIFGTVEEAERSEEGNVETYTLMNDIALDWRADLENAAKSRYKKETEQILRIVRDEERAIEDSGDTTKGSGDIQPTAEVHGEEKGTALYSKSPIQYNDTPQDLINKGLKENYDHYQAATELARILGDGTKITPWRLPDSLIKRERKRRVNRGPVSTGAYEVAEKLSKIFGKEIVWVTAEGVSLNGVVVPKNKIIGDKIFIEVRSDNPAHVIYGHELLHHLKVQHPKLYADLESIIEPLIKNADKYNSLRSLKLSPELTREEIIADLLGDSFNNPQFWAEVANQSPSKFRQIARKVRQWINNILGKLNQSGFGSERYVTDLQAAQKALTRFIAQTTSENGRKELAESALGMAKFATVWHGTPHRGIEQFSTDYIGTGEGAQAFGHGLYFSDKEDVAEWYRNNLTREQKQWFIDGTPINKGKDAYGVLAALPEDFTREDAIEFVNKWADYYEKEGSSIGSLYREAEWLLKNSKSFKMQGNGQLYKVEIPEDNEMLLWDKPLSEQSEKVKKAYAENARFGQGWFEDKQENDLYTGSWLYRHLEEKFGDPSKVTAKMLEDMGLDPYGDLGQYNNDQLASMYLSSLGIKGIKYLDGVSRDGSGDGYNYVIFDGADTKILETKYSVKESPNKFKPVDTNSESFKKWFKGSKIVDENGEPLVVYHGTDYGVFNSFVPENGKPIWFAHDPELSDRYSMATDDYEGMTYPVYLNITNPLDLTGKYDANDKVNVIELVTELGLPDVAANIPKFLEDGYVMEAFQNREVLEGLKEYGFDGVVINETGLKSYAVFSPTQIKSAISNTGEFSSTNPDIRYSVAERNSSIFGASNRPDTIDRIIGSNPKFKDLWERFVYQGFDKDDPRRRVMERAPGVTEKTDILTVERLRGKVTADETERFMDTFVQPLLKVIAKAKLKTADLEEYKHALHAPERNLRMRQVNALRHIDMVKQHLNTQEKEALDDELLWLRSDIIMSGGTMAERQNKYIEVLERILSDTDTMQDALNVDQQELDIREFTDKEIDKGTPEFLQKRLDNRQKHIDAIRGIATKWNTESIRYAGITDGEARAIVRKWNSDERIGDIKEAGRLLDKINRHRLDVLYDGGQLTKEEYHDLTNGYKYYVPLHRDVEQGSGKPATGRSTGPLGRPIQVAKGSMLEVVDILAHSVANTQAAINRKHKAKAGEILLNFVRENPNTGITIEKQKKKPTHDKDGNIVMYPEQMEADNELYVKVKGEKYVLSFDTKDKTVARFLESIKGADTFLNGPMKMLSKLTRIIAAVNTTYSPEFVLSNFARDLQTAGINLEDTKVKGMQARVFKNIFPAIKGIMQAQYGKDNTTWGKIYRDFSRSGGKIGWMQSYEEITDLAKELKSGLEMHEEGHVVKKVFRNVRDLISNTNMAIENGVRVAVYHEMTKVASKQKAAMTASNLTVDFTRRGASGPAINALYMFFNAGVQGNIRIIKTLARSGKAKAIVGGIGALGAALQMLAYAVGGDDDRGQPYIDGIADWEKERNMIFMIPNTKGENIKIPMPYGYNVFFNIGAELAMAFNSGDKYDIAKGAMRIANVAMSSFNPIHSATIAQSISPTVFDPMVMIAENKTFTNAPLMPDNKYGNDKADAYRYWKSASGPAKGVAQWLNKISGGKGEYEPGLLDFSPETIELWYDNITGSAGRFAKSLITVPLDMAKGEEIETSRIPFVRRVYGEWSDRSISTDYYDEVEKINRLVNNIKTAKTKEERKEFSSDPLIKLVPMMRATEKMLKDLRSNKKIAEASGRDTDLFDEEIVKRQTNFLKRSAAL